MRIISFQIEPKDDGKQIKQFLKEFGVSAALLTRLKQSENGIKKNGVFAKAIEFLHSGDELTITISKKGKSPTKTKMDIEIAYEDEDIIVLNKPPLVPVHESRNHRGDTLANFVAYHLDTDNAFRAVYRLDRDTSGLVLVAKHELAASKLAGNIKKDYYAVVSGVITENGEINAPIARCGASIIKRKVDKDGETAITQYYPISEKNGNTLVRFNLLTGRTHQIRVHCDYIGHTLLGDDLYGGDTSKINRQALHCKDIYFVHPITNEDMHISSEFPNDFLEVI